MTKPRSLALLLLMLLASNSVHSQSSDGALSVARQLLDAFNQHDAAQMADLVDAQFELIYVSADGSSEIAARGPEQLQSQMVDYFAARPTVRSDIEGSIDGPRFVAFRERPMLDPDATEKRPSSLAVYEVVEGKILRAWYFPAEPPAAPAQ